MNRGLVGWTAALALANTTSPATAQTHLGFSGDDGPYQIKGGRHAKMNLTPEQRKQNRRYNRFYFVTCNPTYPLMDHLGHRIVVPPGYKWPNGATPDCVNHNDAVDAEAKADG